MTDRAEPWELHGDPAQRDALEQLQHELVTAKRTPVANLDRIPDHDERAKEILAGVPSSITPGFLQSLSRDDCEALGFYGVRAATIALRRRDPSVLRQGLLALAIAAGAENDDPRDLMVSMTLHRVVARKLHQSPRRLFNDVAVRFQVDDLQALLRSFGRRSLVTLRSMGWKRVRSDQGPDFCRRP